MILRVLAGPVPVWLEALVEVENIDRMARGLAPIVVVRR